MGPQNFTYKPDVSNTNLLKNCYIRRPSFFNISKGYPPTANTEISQEEIKFQIKRLSWEYM